MARDYAARNKRPAPKPAGLPGWVWLTAGLSMGLVVAAIVYIGRPADSMPMAPAAGAVVRGAAPAPAPREAVEIPPTEEPRFDFYTLLEKEQVVLSSDKPATNKPAAPLLPPIPEPDAPADAPAQTDAAAPADAAPRPAERTAAVPAPRSEVTPAPSPKGGERYLVVAGAFREQRNAEEHKARLALAGIESGIESIRGQDASTWHRVRIGPQNLARSESLLAKLRANGFDGRVVRMP